MPETVAKIDLWSNNPDLQMAFIKSNSTPQVKFFEYNRHSDHSYLVVLVDLNGDLSGISQEIINTYDHCRSKTVKLAVVICHGDSVDGEKNLYFSQLLDQVGGDSPLHRLVLTKDLYQDTFDAGTCLEKVILESIKNRKINISRKGNQLLYPVSTKDCTAALQKILFLSGTAGKTFWLVGDSITDLDLAYLLQKNLEDTAEIFEIEATNSSIQSIALDSLGNQSRAILSWEPVEEFSVNLKGIIRRICEDSSLLLSNIHQSEKSAKHPRWFKILKIKNSIYKKLAHLKTKKGSDSLVKTSQQVIAKTIEMSLALVLILYLLITLVFITTTSTALVNLEKTLSAIREGNIAETILILKKSSTYSQIGEASYRFVSPVFSFVAPNFHEKNHNLFVFLHYSQASLENLQQTFILAEKIYQSIGNPSTTLNYNDASLALKSNLSQVFENITEVLLLTKSGKLPNILEEKLVASTEYKNLSLVESQIAQLIKSIDLIPAFLGGENAKNIIFLFQNSQEIRSTGGVVDYLLAVVLDKGKIVSRDIYSSSDIDSLVAGGIVAPALINYYTGSENWKVRDLNYNPDFSSTANNFASVIDKSLKFKPDVIVAVNESLIQSLLDQDKGVIINGQSITTETFLNELPKSTPSVLYRQLIDYYVDEVANHKVSLLSLGRVLSEQSSGSQMLFWTADENIERSINSQSLSGGVYPHGCHNAFSNKVNCLAHTSYFNESNFSLVPVGRDLQKKIVHKITFDRSSVRHEYLIDYKFTKAFPNLNRDLSEIVQVYAPENSTIDRIMVNNKDISLGAVQVLRDNSLERFQIPISLKFNQNNRVEISFTTQLSEDLRLPFAYSHTEYRQPGLRSEDGSVELIVKVPNGSRAASITAPADSTPEGYNYIFPAKTSTFGIGFEPTLR